MAESEKPHEKSLEGWTAPLDTDAERREAIEKAFDYRGDVTLTTADGRTIEGYVYDRRTDGDEPALRLLSPDGSRTRIPYSDLTGLTFSGKDAAHGKSFEAWIRKFIEKKTGDTLKG